MHRFLHTADWQIGRQYSQFSPDDAVPLADARLEVIETIARLANEHAVDAVLVAGDVFDAQTVTVSGLVQCAPGGIVTCDTARIFQLRTVSVTAKKST